MFLRRSTIFIAISCHARGEMWAGAQLPATFWSQAYSMLRKLSFTREDNTKKGTFVLLLKRVGL